MEGLRLRDEVRLFLADEQLGAGSGHGRVMPAS